eukprot:jgi/Ulvmu1/12435/UM009_0087.1
MLQNGVTLLALLAACTSSVSAQTPLPLDLCVSSRSDTSACVWTGDCDKPGCGNKCITNFFLTNSWYTLLDHSTGDTFFSACPTLAYWVNLWLSVKRGTGRRLLSQNDAVNIMKASRTRRSVVDSADVLGGAASRSLLNVSDADSPAPGPATGGGFSADIPSNMCPTLADVEEAAEHMKEHARRLRMVFEVDASGEPMPSELEDIAWILEEPNTYQWLVARMEDPDRVATYIRDNCAPQALVGLDAFQYQFWLDPDGQELLESDLSMVQCVDNFGAYEQFAKDYQSVRLACYPPFGLEPDCFSSFGHYIISSPACATAYARLFNINDPTPLTNVAANVINIQAACNAVTTKAECLAADTPVLDTIDDLHNDIPIQWPLEFAPTSPGGTIAPTQAVCFTDCEDTADTADTAGAAGAAPAGGSMAPSGVVIGGSGGPEAPPPLLDRPGAPPERPPEGEQGQRPPAGFDDNGPADIAGIGAALPLAGSAAAAAATLLTVLLM